MSTKYRDQRDRAARLAYDAKLEPESVKEIELIVLLMLDAAKRGRATASMANTLTDHVAACQVHWVKRANRALYDRSLEAWQALCKACQRPTQYLDLTTSEYRAIRETLLLYLKQLRDMKVGDFVTALSVAREKLNYANNDSVVH